VKALLDTHSLLWFALNDARLSGLAKSTISDGDNGLFVSPATFWEIAIKISLGKYEIREEFADFFSRQMTQNGFTVLPITLEHAAIVAKLPVHHRDPFDRLLVAQAMWEGIPIISADRELDPYPVKRIW
jgi:PIN domain nuclease of toxin-antitoxin system